MILENIKKPADLKNISYEDLKILTEELREEIIQTVSSVGGHLAPNLGVIELTIALHYVLNTPEDKIIWDVGHQSYAHKLLTGRQSLFHMIRQQGGISGFPRRSESEYDCFGTGHSSTSISAALGFACARDLKRKDYRIAAVIGDGSMTGGMAFEALNNVGHLKKDLFVILNDNEMFISKKVGALGEYLTRIMTFDPVHRAEEKIEKILKKSPHFGREVLKLLKRSKVMLTPGMLFEEMGFNYFGPVAGHELNTLIENVDKVASMDGPRILHVITKKGKGYKPALDNPERFHGTGKFDIKSGKPLKKKKDLSYQDVLGRSIVKLAEKDDRIVAITAAMKSGTGLDEFSKRFPHRYFDVGIAEQHAVTFAAGMAADGLKPVCAIYSTFLQRAYDQIIHDVALQELDVIFAVDRAGIVGEDGPTHHGIFDLSFFSSVPGMTVAAPSCAKELEKMLEAALDWSGPCAIRYPRGVAVKMPDGAKEKIEKGRGVLLKKGKDITIAAIGNMVAPALEASNRLQKEGISSSVINLRFAKPIDTELISRSASRTGKIITVEENTIEGGVGDRIRRILPEGIKVRNIAIDDEFVTYGHADYLRRQCGLDSEGIFRAAMEVCSENRN
ncbi:MAG: 1-deoxy-D-xylulose-5-phosphate synthase [Elusimicrobiota bacterium]